MNATINGLGVELPREEDRRPAQDLVVLLGAADLGLELADLGQLRSRGALAVAAVDLGPHHPAAHRLLPHPTQNDAASNLGRFT